MTSFVVHGHIFESKQVIFHCNNISQYHCFNVFLNQINAALASIKNLQTAKFESAFLPLHL